MNETVTELGPEPDDRDLADLCALADGSLPVERRAEVEARIAASPRLAAMLARQRRALEATALLADEPVRRRSPRASRRPSPRRAAERARRHAGSGGGAGGWHGGCPRAARSPRRSRSPWCSRWAAAPRRPRVGRGAAGPRTGGRPGPRRMARATRNWPSTCRAWNSPTTHELLAGRPAACATVGSAAARRPSSLFQSRAPHRLRHRRGSRPAAAVRRRGGRHRPHPVSTVSFEGRAAVTWRRLGHTCVLIGDAPRAELLSLASWRAGGTLGTSRANGRRAT